MLATFGAVIKLGQPLSPSCDVISLQMQHLKDAAPELEHKLVRVNVLVLTVNLTKY